jgi:hypothetical protein
VDPLSPFPRCSEPFQLFVLGKKAEAVERAREVMDLFPWYWISYFLSGVIPGGSGLQEEAASALKRGLTIDPGNVFLLAAVALAHGWRGELAEAQRIREELERTARTRYVSPAALAIASKGCGDVDRTCEWLSRGVDERDPLTITVGSITPFPGHGRDARYIALLSRMNLSHLVAPPKTGALSLEA